MSVTIKDVAKYANVAPSTVSRVLKDNPRISKATKDKVREAMEMLGYYPNAIAQSLANKSSYTLGLLLPSSVKDAFINPFFTEFIRGVSRYTQKRDYSLLIASAKDEDDELNHITRLVNSKRVDGIILLTVRENDRNVDYLQKEDFPFVVVGTPKDTENILWVDNDNRKAMYEVVEYLITKNNKRIAFLGGSKRLKVTSSRLEGYKQALENYGIPIKEELILEGNFSEEEGYRVAAKLMKEDDSIDAIVTTDDIIAFGCIKAIKDSGHSIPKDISVVGFNNTILARLLEPSLTSVEINSARLGMYASRLLIDKIRIGDLLQNSYTIKTKIVVRESTN